MSNRFLATLGFALLVSAFKALSQSSDWTEVVWREPQVRYLLADMTGGGNPGFYRKYATEEKDPDSREALRLWDAGVRVVNMADFERKWVANSMGKDGKVFRVVQRGTDRTIQGGEAILSIDGSFDQSAMRLALLDLTLGASEAFYKQSPSTPIQEALRLWHAGGRAINAHLFKALQNGARRELQYAATGLPVDGMRIVLNSDLPYPEVNVRYFLADMMLGGSRDFYHRAAESAHEKGCEEAVARFDAGVKITNLDRFERKTVDGKTLITRKGDTKRISGGEVRLSSD